MIFPLVKVVRSQDLELDLNSASERQRGGDVRIFVENFVEGRKERRWRDNNFVAAVSAIGAT